MGARLAEFIGITPEDKGTIRIIKFNEGNLDKFKVKGDSIEELEKALDDFEAGTLKAYYKSEAVPE